jgi:hypothetical protein
VKRAAWALAVLGALGALGGRASAEDVDASVDPLGASVGDKELGVRLGLQLAQGVAPGGFSVAGAYLHRMTRATWFELELAFTLGGNDPFCFRDRFGETVCDPGLTDGVSGQLAAGGRWFPSSTPSGFLPYLRGGLGLHWADFGGDEVSGLAGVGFAGAGGRFRVGGIASVCGEVVLFGGAGLYSDDVGFEPYAGMIVRFGVDLAL